MVTLCQQLGLPQILTGRFAESCQGQARKGRACRGTGATAAF